MAQQGPRRVNPLTATYESSYLNTLAAAAVGELIAIGINRVCGTSLERNVVMPFVTVGLYNLYEAGSKIRRANQAAAAPAPARVPANAGGAHVGVQDADHGAERRNPRRGVRGGQVRNQ